jgi:hypothetical protein
MVEEVVAKRKGEDEMLDVHESKWGLAGSDRV